MKKKLLTLFITLTLIVSMFPAVALAVDVHDKGSYDISGASDGDNIYVDAGATATITGSHNNVQIVCDPGVHLTLDGVTIDNSAIDKACALIFTGSGNTLTLTGTSTLKSGNGNPGIRVEEGTELTIGGTGTLNADGGGYGAGIGGSEVFANCGTVIINSGTITARSHGGGAGIGGAHGVDSSNGGNGGIITINGGTVEASGSLSGAGIGGGGGNPGGSAGIITINGGSVTATGDNMAGGAGIGGGGSTDEGSTGGGGGRITIADGTVVAYGGLNGAGIGSGVGSEDGSVPVSGGNISISGGTVTANCGYGGAGIGGGMYGTGGTITISGSADVTARGSYGAGIGGGYNASGETIVISSGIVNASASGSGAAIGGGGGWNPGEGGAAGDITISGGTVFAGSAEAHDIGDGKNPCGSGTFAISGDAAAFIRNNRSLIPTTTTHYLFSEEINGGRALACNMPASGWDNGITAYAYLRGYAVTFDTKDGTPAVPSQTVYHGGKVTPPDADPAKEGYTFGGWYKQTECTDAWDFSADTVTAAATLYAKWTPVAPEPTPTPKPTATPEPDVKMGNITGTILDSNGKPLAHYPVTLHSDPITVMTDSTGKFQFTNVPLTNHILIIKTDDSTEIGQYALTFTENDSASYSVDGKDIDISYTVNTVNIDVLINVSEDGAGMMVEEIAITENPKTGDASMDYYWWTVPTIAAISLFLVIGRKRLKQNQ